MIWISLATGWAIPDVPKYVLFNDEQMIQMAYDCAGEGAVENKYICEMPVEELTNNPAIIKPIALFDTRDHVIMLPDDFDEKKIRDQSILLHELVHYMQWKLELYPKNYTCRQQTEFEAYDLQEKFLAERGLDLHKVIKIGPLLRFMVSHCDGGAWGR